MTTPSKFSSKAHKTFLKTLKSQRIAPVLTFPPELCEPLTFGVVCLVLTSGLPFDRSFLGQWPGTQHGPPGCQPSHRPADLHVTGRHTSKCRRPSRSPRFLYYISNLRGKNTVQASKRKLVVLDLMISKETLFIDLCKTAGLEGDVLGTEIMHLWKCTIIFC